jgi:hypothetical protein
LNLAFLGSFKDQEEDSYCKKNLMLLVIVYTVALGAYVFHLILVTQSRFSLFLSKSRLGKGRKGNLLLGTPL